MQYSTAGSYKSFAVIPRQSEHRFHEVLRNVTEISRKRPTCQYEQRSVSRFADFADHLDLREAYLLKDMAKVYVGGIDVKATEADIEDEFKVYGTLRSVWVGETRIKVSWRHLLHILVYIYHVRASCCERDLVCDQLTRISEIIRYLLMCSSQASRLCICGV